MMDVELLKSIFRYDPETGYFVRTIKRGNRASSGAIAGYIDASGYRKISVGRKNYYAHRLAWLYMTGALPETEIDHRNRARDDNRWQNLRPATHSENGMNARVRSDNRAGMKGAQYIVATGRWRAKIKLEGRNVSLGCYDTPEEAHDAFMAAAVRRNGEFVCDGRRLATGG